MLHYRLHRDPRSSHQQISRYLKQLRPRLTLDVGAAQGFLGQLLSGSGLTLDAVELNPRWAEAARPFYRTVYPCAIEHAPLPPGTRYDAIVCADVLEHVPDPAGVISQLLKVATADAAFIISLPNVAHLAVRLMLLFGYFPRMDRGILDRTHLHFLTKDTARQLLESAGLQVQRVSCTGVPLDEVFKKSEGKLLFNLAMRCQHLALSLLPRLFAMQWIFFARPAPNAGAAATTPSPGASGQVQAEGSAQRLIEPEPALSPR
jgi:2-polyprenyl-3-methyl-5-hydroxy-6-metoxy-1,4-benzoquinol methylase